VIGTSLYNRGITKNLQLNVNALAKAIVVKQSASLSERWLCRAMKPGKMVEAGMR
jgi:hypothetical protein